MRWPRTRSRWWTSTAGAFPGAACRRRTVVSAVSPAAQPAGSQQAVVEAALVLLERMGLSPADLVAVPQGPGGGADVRRVRLGGVGGGERRDPPGVRLVLEPD